MNDVQKLLDDLALLTGMTAKERQDAIRWYARQSEDFRVQLMTSRFKTFHRLKQKREHPDMPTLEYAALLIAIKGLGWLSQKKAGTRMAASKPELLEQVAERRKEKSQQLFRPRAKAEIVRKKWGLVVEYRREGLGFRKIAKSLSQEHGVNVSHTYLRTLWTNWEE